MPVPRARRAVLACAVALAAISAAPLAHAAPEETAAAESAAEARQQYGLGQKAFAAKRYSEAALHFESAAAFKASGIALYSAASAWDLASRPERAADAYARALEAAGLDEKQTATAKDRIAALEKSLGTLEVKAPEGWKVQLDTFTEVKAPARLHASGGVHTLSIHAPDKPIERRDVMLEAGKTQALELKDEPKPPPKVEEPPKKEEPPPPEPPPMRLREPFWTTRKAVGVGVVGVGVAALGATALLGVQASGAEDAYNAAPNREAYDHAKSLQTWTNIGLFTGGLLVAGGIVLIVLPGDRGGFRAGIKPGGVELGGTF
ncbi:MAG: hypothetical protein KIT84_36480 [Labilithrix sp.]|nr:hypothetical protein [Labilithrix sp.]MCW5816553.1 hypothetical protein [Labilithrix sp.]